MTEPIFRGLVDCARLDSFIIYHTLQTYTKRQEISNL